MIDIIITALARALKEPGRACQVERKEDIATQWNSTNEGEAGSVVESENSMGSVAEKSKSVFKS